MRELLETVALALILLILVSFVVIFLSKLEDRKPSTSRHRHPENIRRGRRDKVDIESTMEIYKER